MSFDFEAAVLAPFRMQPGLRRLAEGSAQLTPAAPGGKHQREKLAVLSAFAQQALVQRSGFDGRAALQTLNEHAAIEHPASWSWDGNAAIAVQLGVRVSVDGQQVQQLSTGAFGLGDEISRCVLQQAPRWRLAALLSLAFEEDFALVDAKDGCVPWMAVALPSHWAPEHKVGLHFSQIHEPVADGELLRRAGPALARLVAGPERWERFVWNVTDSPRLHTHPLRLAHERWSHDTQASGLPRAWFRSERQTFIPVPGQDQSLFTIQVQVQPLEVAIHSAARAARLAAAVRSMSPAVLAYRGLTPVHQALLDWLAARHG